MKHFKNHSLGSLQNRRNMVFKMLFSLTLFLSVFSVKAQEQLLPPDLWYNGEIILLDSTSVVGKVKYDFQGNTILLKSRGEVETYTPRTVLKMQFSDSTGKERLFIIRNFKNKKEFQMALFFEVLVKGDVNLYTREEVVYYSAGNMASQGFQSEIKRLLVYEYFFQSNSGKIYYFKPMRKYVLKVFKEKQDEIKEYVKNNKLRYTSKKDLIEIFRYYNTL